MTYSGFTMCPDKVGRYASQFTGTRTLTISGLDNSKLYLTFHYTPHV